MEGVCDCLPSSFTVFAVALVCAFMVFIEKTHYRTSLRTDGPVDVAVEKRKVLVPAAVEICARNTARVCASLLTLHLLGVLDKAWPLPLWVFASRARAELSDLVFHARPPPDPSPDVDDGKWDGQQARDDLSLDGIDDPYAFNEETELGKAIGALLTFEPENRLWHCSRITEEAATTHLTTTVAHNLEPEGGRVRLVVYTVLRVWISYAVSSRKQQGELLRVAIDSLSSVVEADSQASSRRIIDCVRAVLCHYRVVKSLPNLLSHRATRSLLDVKQVQAVTEAGGTMDNEKLAAYITFCGLERVFVSLDHSTILACCVRLLAD